MGKIRKNEAGFSPVEVVMVLVIVALIGMVGWLVYKNHNKTTNNSATTANTSTTKSTTSTPSTSQQPAATAPSLLIKEWGIKVEFADANSVIYKIAGNSWW